MEDSPQFCIKSRTANVGFAAHDFFKYEKELGIRKLEPKLQWRLCGVEDPTLNKNSPYYVHPNENPSAVAVIKRCRIQAWERCNNLIHSWIVNSLTPTIAQSVAYIENAIDVWNDLRERFSQGDLIRIVELQQELCAFKQGTMSRPVPQCTCLAMRNSRLYRQNYVLRFLIGLNEEFAAVKQGGRGMHCGKSGHTIETCYEKYGFPPTFGAGRGT
ncbi:hypothetical protein CR513_07054, partial [Mucuna pruriens]